MSTDRELLQQALEALENVKRVMDAADRYASEVADTPHMPTPVERKLAETKIESRRAELERVVREALR